MKKYYNILGVDASAKKEEIKKAYLTLAKKYHPDVSKDPNALELFKEILEAYETLYDEDKRAKYDRSLVIDKLDEVIDYLYGNAKKNIIVNIKTASERFKNIEAFDDNYYYYISFIYNKERLEFLGFNIKLNEMPKWLEDILNKLIKNKAYNYLYLLHIYDFIKLYENKSLISECLNYFLTEKETDFVNQAIGECYFLQEKYDKAIMYLMKAKNRPRALILLGYYELSNNQVKKAWEYYITAIANGSFTAYMDCGDYCAAYGIKDSTKYYMDGLCNIIDNKLNFYCFKEYARRTLEFCKKYCDYSDFKPFAIKIIKYINNIDFLSARDIYINIICLIDEKYLSVSEAITIKIKTYEYLASNNDATAISYLIKYYLSDSPNNEALEVGFKYILKQLQINEYDGKKSLFKYFEIYNYEPVLKYVCKYENESDDAKYLIGRYYYLQKNNEEALKHLLFNFQNEKANNIIFEIYQNSYSDICHIIDDSFMNSKKDINNKSSIEAHSEYLKIKYNKYLKMDKTFVVEARRGILNRYICHLLEIDYEFILMDIKLDYFKDVDDTCRKAIFNKLLTDNKNNLFSNNLYKPLENVLNILARYYNKCPICGRNLEGIFKNKCSRHGKINFK